MTLAVSESQPRVHLPHGVFTPERRPDNYPGNYPAYPGNLPGR